MASSAFKPLLYLICILADFAGFVVVFAVSRSLAENHVPLWYLGLAGAAFTICSGVTNIVGGWLSQRFGSCFVFVCGSVATAIAVAACGFGHGSTTWFLPGYCLLGAGLGTIYPIIIGWLNHDQDAHANHRGVSRTLILFCVAWNVGMMCGQMTSGELFSVSPRLAYGAAFAAASMNVALAGLAVRFVSRSFGESSSDSGYMPKELPQESVPVVNSASIAVAARFRYLSWIANAGGTFGGSLVFHLLPDLAVTIGVSPENHGGLLAYWRGVVIVTCLLMHVSGFWRYRFSASLVSQSLGVIGLIAIALADSSTALIIGVSLHGQLAGYNYFSGLFYSAARSTREGRTQSAGIHEATLAVGMAAGTLAGGIIGTVAGPRAPWYLAAIVLSTLIGSQILAWRRWSVSIQQELTTAEEDTDNVCEEGIHL